MEISINSCLYISQQPAPGANSSSNKGLLGMVAGAGTAVAGALGASHLLGVS